MSRPILFEDHGLARLRPLCWSMPQFEVRCGMFCLRERVGLLVDGRPGRMLMRTFLHAGAQDPAWGAGFQSEVGGQADLWLAGRLGPRWDVLQGLLTLPAATPDFLWLDDKGLVAARLGPERSGALAASWSRWEAECAGVEAWCRLAEPPMWDAAATFPDFQVAADGGGPRLLLAPRGDQAAGKQLAAGWRSWAQAEGALLDWIWEVVPLTAAAVASDLAACRGRTARPRRPFGITARRSEPSWSLAGWPVPAAERISSREAAALGPRCDPAALHLGEDVQWEPGLVVDTDGGPVVLERGVRIQAHVRLQGPLYVGPESVIKAGARIYGESSFGVGNRLAGEIGESTFGDFANKQHEGFIGHAVVGSWVNLGALTTCSDLKNNYGPVRVDLGWGPLDTGRRFVGLMAGDHVKTAIGTLLNTGTVVGFCANLFGATQPPKVVRNFSWGGQPHDPLHALDKALATAATVLARRDCALGEAQAEVFRVLAGHGGE